MDNNDRGKVLDELIQERAFRNANNGLISALREQNLIVTENTKKDFNDEQILTTSDICALLKCERHLVYQLAETKQLRGFKKKNWKFTVKAYRDYINREMK